MQLPTGCGFHTKSDSCLILKASLLLVSKSACFTLAIIRSSIDYQDDVNLEHLSSLSLKLES